MKAALYARYSSDKQRDSSIADQFYNCERIAEKLGFMVVSHFEDKAITGTHRIRPGYQLMLEAAQRGDFDVLIVDDLSRLSRDNIETQQIIREFKYRRQRVIAISDGFDSNDKSYKLQAGVRGIVNDIYIDDLREKTRRGLSGKAREGKSTGGSVYGYKRKPIIDHTRMDEYGRPLVVEVEREIDSEQAKWVVQIFEWFAEGHPPIWIAAKLNQLGVPSPRGTTWARSAIYGDMKRNTGLLNNELYIGKMIWNRREWVKGPDGKRKPLMRTMSEYITKDCPDLRIISDELWQAKCERQKSIRQKTTRLQESLAKSTGAGPKYLFSGLLKCGCCGSNYTIIGKTYYGCARHRDRGAIACSNDITIKRDVVEDVLLKGIRDSLFSPEATQQFLRECNIMVGDIEANHAHERKELEKRAKQLEGEIKNLIGFIKAGTALPSITEEIQAAEHEKRRLDILLRKTPPSSADIMNIVPHAMERYRASVEHLGNIRPEQLAEARIQLKEITGGAIKLTPFDGEGLAAEVRGDYANLIAKSSIMLVAGAGFEPAAFRL
jgi:site-specific DNA recombinase